MELIAREDHRTFSEPTMLENTHTVQRQNANERAQSTQTGTGSGLLSRDGIPVLRTQ